MKRTILVFLLLPVVCAAGCARPGTVQGTDRVPLQRAIALGDDITVPAGPALTALPSDARYRFVPPDQLARGVGADDIASTEEAPAEALRKEFAATVSGAQWVEAADAAEYDVTIFTTARLKTRRETREQLVANVSTPVARCDVTYRPQTSQCTDDAIVYTEVANTEYHTIHIIRRRSDGAVRVWRLPGIARMPARSRVKAELTEMLRAGRP